MANPLIVLRFRDIEPPPGETIARHRRSIAEHGYCWWGWLFREYEHNPHDRLMAIRQAWGQSSFPVALFDTGRSLIFRATCSEIRATPKPQKSPDPAATPAYYNHKRAPAWFRFTDVEEAPLSLIIGRSCIEMPSASEECFVDLLGQTVVHLKDLRRQEVTLWVLG